MARYKLVLENGSSQYGAQMGRPDTLPDDRSASITLHLTKMRMSADGVYDNASAYWGSGSTTHGWMYCAETGNDQPEYARVFVRAGGRLEAKALVRARLPNANFHLSPEERSAERDQAWDEGYQEGRAGIVRGFLMSDSAHLVTGYKAGKAALAKERARHE